jgi:hypothetical protein
MRTIRGGLVCLMGLLALVLGTIPAWATESKHVTIEVFAPKGGDVAGVGGRAFFVDLKAVFHDATLAETGAGLELTGPGAHQTAPPFPSPFGVGADDKFPGLIVLLSTTQIGVGPGQNLAGLFNLVGVTNRDDQDTEIWATWIVGAPGFGASPANPGPVEATLLVAVAGDTNGNGVFDDAPDVVPDMNGDGVIDEKDLKLIGVASNIKKVKFSINGSP